jgi:hypothetical protein
MNDSVTSGRDWWCHAPPCRPSYAPFFDRWTPGMQSPAVVEEPGFGASDVIRRSVPCGRGGCAGSQRGRVGGLVGPEAGFVFEARTDDRLYG